MAVPLAAALPLALRAGVPQVGQAATNAVRPALQNGSNISGKLGSNGQLNQLTQITSPQTRPSLQQSLNLPPRTSPPILHHPKPIRPTNLQNIENQHLSGAPANHGMNVTNQHGNLGKIKTKPYVPPPPPPLPTLPSHLTSNSQNSPIATSQRPPLQMPDAVPMQRPNINGQYQSTAPQRPPLQMPESQNSVSQEATETKTSGFRNSIKAGWKDLMQTAFTSSKNRTDGYNTGGNTTGGAGGNNSVNTGGFM